MNGDTIKKNSNCYCRHHNHKKDIVKIASIFVPMFFASSILALLNYQYMTAFGNTATVQPDSFSDMRIFSLPIISQSAQNHHYHLTAVEGGEQKNSNVIAVLKGEEAFRLGLAIDNNIGIDFINGKNANGEITVSLVLAINDEEKDTATTV